MGRIPCNNVAFTFLNVVFRASLRVSSDKALANLLRFSQQKCGTASAHRRPRTTLPTSGRSSPRLASDCRRRRDSGQADRSCPSRKGHRFRRPSRSSRRRPCRRKTEALQLRERPWSPRRPPRSSSRRKRQISVSQKVKRKPENIAGSGEF